MSRSLLTIFVSMMEVIVEEGHAKQVTFCDGYREMVHPHEASAFLTLSSAARKKASKDHGTFMNEIGKRK